MNSKKCRILIILLSLFMFIIIASNYSFATEITEVQSNKETNLYEEYEVDLVQNKYYIENDSVTTFNSLNEEDSIEQYLKDQIMQGKYLIDVSNYNVEVNTITNIINKMLNYNPECYVFNKWQIYYNLNSLNKKIAKNIVLDFFIPEQDVEFYYREVQAKTEKFVNSIPNNSSEVEKILYIYNYICDNTEYDYENLNKNTIPAIDHSMYGFFLNGITVCDGYSAAFNYLASQLGIESYMVTSSSMNHAWNTVKVGDSYYHLDATWDDSIFKEEIYGRWGYKFFLLSSNKMRETHQWTDAYGDFYSEVSCDSTKYDNSFIQNIFTPIIEVKDIWYIPVIKNGYVYLYKINNLSEAIQYARPILEEEQLSKFKLVGNIINPIIRKDGDNLFIVYDNKIGYYSPENEHYNIYVARDIIYGFRIRNGVTELQLSSNLVKERNKITENICYIDCDDIDFNVKALNFDTDTMYKNFIRRGLELNKTYKLNSVAGAKWSSSNNSVAIVDNNGNLKTVGAGFAYITAQYNNHEASILIGVREYVKINFRFRTDVGKILINSSENITTSILYPKNSNLILSYNPNSDRKIIEWDINNQKISVLNIALSKILSDINITLRTSYKWNSYDIENKIFDYKYYADTYADLKNAFGYNESALKNHWKNNGIKEGRVASRNFNAKYYLYNNSDLKKAFGVSNYTAAYNHFVNIGYAEGRPSAPNYNGEYYRLNNSDLFLLDYGELLNHYEYFGYKENRKATDTIDLTPINITNYLFNSYVYAELNSDLKKVFGYNESALKNHWLTFGIKEGRTASLVFNAKDYSNLYPDLKNAFGTNYIGLYNHFINNGISEGRKASNLFDVKYYLNNYSDLKNTFSTNYSKALVHFVNSGLKEGRNSSSTFKIAIYKSNYEDLRNAFKNNNILYYLHYITNGKRENRIAY